MAELEFKQINKYYGDTHIVKGFDLKIEEGEFVVLLGSSGCGKSTTLRMVAGLESISEGDLLIHGRRVNDLEPKERNIAMVFQSYALYPHMTVYDNIAFGLKLSKMDKAEIDEKVNWAAEMLQMSHLLQRKPKDLSGGQRQRVAMGRAMVRTPDVFLFDEPLSNLDAKLRHKMRVEIKALHKELKKTTIYVTHDQVEAMTLADRIVIMHEGVIAQVGSPREIYSRPANTYVAGFIGSPEMNMLSGSMMHEGHQWRFSVQEQDFIADLDIFPADLSGREVVLGIRPGFIHLRREAIPHDCFMTCNARIESIELLGATCNLDCKVGDQDMVAEVPSSDDLKEGDLVQLYLDCKKLHLFDENTGQAILHTCDGFEYPAQ